jgi:hypothetical protein
MPSISYFDYGGSNQVSLGSLKTVKGGGSPMRLQKQSFPAIPGKIILNHGTDSKIMVFDGLVWTTQASGDTLTLIGLTDAIAAVAKAGITGTFRHNLVNGNNDYSYCVVTNVVPSKNFGVGGGLRTMKYKLTIEQLYW